MSSFRGKAKRLWVLASLGLLVACSGGSAPTSAPVSVPGPPSISPPPAVLASPGPGRFVYVASADGVISIYAIGASSGRLLRVGTETPGGALSQIVAHPSGSLIYAVGGIGANVPPSGTPIWQYKVGSTGALSRLAGPVNVPGAIVNSHDPLVIHPSGLFAYALMDGGGVQQFSIGVDGALSVAAMIDTPSLSKLTVDPSGRFAYAETLLPTGPLPVNGPQFRDFWQASIDGNGLLVNGLVVRPSRAPAASEGHFQLLVDPSTSVLLARGNNIDRVAIGADGALASVLLVTPLPQDTDGFAGLFAVRPVGKSLYSTSGGFASRGHNFVAQFALSAGGNLAPLSPPTVATGGNQPTSIAVESSGKYAYVLDSIRDSLVTTGGADQGVSQYKIGVDGALTFNGSITAGGNGLTSLAIAAGPATGGGGGGGPVPGPFAAPRFAYVANNGTAGSPGSISQFSVAADGSLSPLAAGDVAAGKNPWLVALHPSARFAYVGAIGSTLISQFSVAADGSLAPLPTPTVDGTGPMVSITMHPSGGSAYGVSGSGANGVQNFLRQFNIAPDGTMSAMSQPLVPAGFDPTSVALDPTGRFAYVVDLIGAVALQYSIGADGSLAPIGTPVPTGLSPGHIVVHPSGRSAYVSNMAFVNGGPSTVSQYSVGPDGLLSPLVPATVPVGANPRALAMDPVGGFAYVVAGGANEIWQFTIAGDGSLVPMAVPSVVTANQPAWISVDPSGKFAYVPSSSGVVFHTIGADGSLGPASSVVTAGVFPRYVAVSSGPQ